MPRKKAETAAKLVPLEAPEVFDMFQQFDLGYDEMDMAGAMSAAIDFEKVLVQIAHTMAQQAIPIASAEQEAERIDAAHRQTDLLLKLFQQLQTTLKDID